MDTNAKAVRIVVDVDGTILKDSDVGGHSSHHCENRRVCNDGWDCNTSTKEQ